MVRVKHRYLLVDILYPEPSSSPSSASTSFATKSHAQQSQLRIHAPTSDALTPSLLAKMVRDEVADVFGDWGIGRLGGVGAGGVSGMSLFFIFVILFPSCLLPARKSIPRFQC
jgi:ribonuclease P/MRP protein subunit POP5